MFWNEILRAMRGMDLERSTDDPCLYYSWTDIGLVFFFWISDNTIIGTQEVSDKTKKKSMTYFVCEDCGKMKKIYRQQIDLP